MIDKRDSYTPYTIISTLMKDPRIGERIGKEARKTVMERFSWAHTVERISDELEKI